MQDKIEKILRENDVRGSGRISKIILAIESLNKQEQVTDLELLHSLKELYGSISIFGDNNKLPMYVEKELLSSRKLIDKLSSIKQEEEKECEDDFDDNADYSAYGGCEGLGV